MSLPCQGQSSSFPTDWSCISRTLNYYVGIDSPHALGISLRDILLQEYVDESDVDRMLAEVVLCICDELVYGTSSDSQFYCYVFMRELYFVPSARRELERLGQPDGLLDDVAKRISNG